MSEVEAPKPESSVVERVRDMYMRYPYPPLGSDDGVALFGLLDYVRYVLWPGRPTLEGLRVLDAGCGTGFTTVQIALNHPEVEMVGIDLSSASLEVARQRARRAGLAEGARLSFRQASIEDLAPETRPFDYIVSSGVLHHLANPVEGARRLAAVLAPTGGIGGMVYAPHGRHGVYVLQEALRRLVGERDLAEQVGVARQVLAGLPATHPFKPQQFADQDWNGDAGLVDLLLHVQDRSFTVPQLFTLLDESGLRLERFLSPATYRPENHTSDPTLRARLATLGERDGAALAELLSGGMSKHAFFATHAAYRPMRLPAAGVTLMVMRPLRSPLFRWEGLQQQDAAPARAGARQSKAAPRAGARGTTLVERDVGAVTRTLELEPWILTILDRCDGKRTTRQILDEPAVLAAVPGATVDAKLLRCGQLMELLAQQEVVLCEP